jgi:hypothetical protein
MLAMKRRTSDTSDIAVQMIVDVCGRNPKPVDASHAGFPAHYPLALRISISFVFIRSFLHSPFLQYAQMSVSTQNESPLFPAGSILRLERPIIPQKRGLNIVVRDDQRGHRAKVTRACDICKSKKSKCSGDQPCVSCHSRGLLCRYNAVYSRGKAPRPRRVEHKGLPNPPSLVHSRSQSADEPFGVESGISDTLEHQRPHDESLIMLQSTSEEPNEQRVQDVPSGRASPGLEVAGQFLDPTSGLSFLHRVWRRISNDENSEVIVGRIGAPVEDDQLLTCAGDRPLRKPGHRPILPSFNRGKKLLELYFDVCIATYRILHRPSVEEWCAAVLGNEQSDREQRTEVGNSRAAVVLAVLAIASFHEEKANGDDNPSIEMSGSAPQADELFHEAARLSDEERGLPRLESAQSRLIQVLYLLMSSRFNQAWYTFGHALQIISALGLHRKNARRCTPLESHDYIQEQCKRRTFWVAYTLDKYLGVVFGRPRHYHDDDIDQDFPDSVNDENMLRSGALTNSAVDHDCHIDSLIWHAKLAQIAERISREVYSIKSVPDGVRLDASHRLGKELHQWKASLPPLLGSVNPSSLIPSFRRQAIALRLSYCHAVMLAHRPFLLKNTFRNSYDMRMLATESLAECISAAQSVLEMVDRMAREGRMFHAFWWTHYVCFCALAIVYVWVIQDSSDVPTTTERYKLIDEAERCLSHLAQATATNSPSRKYSIILQELRAEAKRKTTRHLQGQTPASRAPRVDHSTVAGAANDGRSSGTDHVQQSWPTLFDGPIDTANPDLQSFLDEWQTTDWLHLDSSAFGPMSEFGNLPLHWT